MQESRLEIETDDGLMPVEKFEASPRAGVIVFMDGFGIRDELRHMCRRFADMGYTAFLPSMYYRKGNPSFPPPNKKGDRPPPQARTMNKATTVAMSVSDTSRLIDAEPGIRDWAAVGYCMGGRHAIGAAASQPDRIKACMSLHGGHMISDDAWSCEKQLPRVRAEVFLGFAKDDPSCPPDHQVALQEAMRHGGANGTVQHFDAEHGWSFPDRHCFDEKASERVWQVAEQLFARRLAA